MKNIVGVQRYTKETGISYIIEITTVRHESSVYVHVHKQMIHVSLLLSLKCIYVYMHVSMRPCVHECMCVCVRVYMCVYMRVWRSVHVCMSCITVHLLNSYQPEEKILYNFSQKFKIINFLSTSNRYIF